MISKKFFALSALFFLTIISSLSYAESTAGKNGILPLGAAAPDFKLQDVVTGKKVSRDDFKGKKALLVMMVCRHCPYVQHVKGAIGKLGRDYKDKDIAIVAISANDPKAYKQDAPDQLKEMAERERYTFPLLFDESQSVAKAYTAVATPDFFLFDKNRKLVYRGQFDDSRPGLATPVTGKDVRDAIDAVLQDKPVPAKQKRAMGCSIKWKAGNEPQYMKG